MLFTTSPIKTILLPHPKISFATPILKFFFTILPSKFLLPSHSQKCLPPYPQLFFDRTPKIFLPTNSFFLPLQPHQILPFLKCVCHFIPKIVAILPIFFYCLTPSFFCHFNLKRFLPPSKKYFYHLTSKVFCNPTSQNFYHPTLKKSYTPAPKICATLTQKVLFYCTHKNCFPPSHPEKNVCYLSSKNVVILLTKFFCHLFAIHSQCLSSWSLACLASRVLGFTHVKNHQKY